MKTLNEMLEKQMNDENFRKEYEEMHCTVYCKEVCHFTNRNEKQSKSHDQGA